jgi:hypothetical protein
MKSRRLMGPLRTRHLQCLTPTTLQQGGGPEMAWACYRPEQSHEGGIAADRSGVRYLLFLNLRDCLDPTRLRGGKRNLVASVHRIQRQAGLCFEVLRCAARIRTTGPALRLLNCDDAIDPVNLGNNSGLGLLGQSRRADEKVRRSTSQNNFCDFQRGLPASGHGGQSAVH